MIRVSCPGCQTKYRFNESLLQGRERGHAKCKKCGETIKISLAETSPKPAAGQGPKDTAASPRPKRDPESLDTTARVRKLRSDEDLGDATTSMSKKLVSSSLDLPPDKKYSLAVLKGKATGQIFAVNKSRMTIGRSGTDILLDDPECSRRHALLEIQGSRTIISDLGSTNGTFVDGQRTDKSELDNRSEFRVGDHVMMLIVTDRE
jgi:predicted Zn finger-like uncharacterized protein